MPKQKLKKFSEIEKFENVVEEFKDDVQKSILKFLDNSKYTTLEVGCGKGEYTIELATRFPDRKFIGIDIKGERIWKGAQAAKKLGLANVLFARFKLQNILGFFPENSIDEIWITFPDPYPRDRDIKRRLSSLPFLQRYKKLVKTQNKIHLKTDDLDLFKFSLELAREQKLNNINVIEDLYSKKIEEQDEKNIKTYYENKHLRNGRKIYYLEFSI